MRRVRFVVDYRGELTRETFYRAGEEAEFEPAVAARLVHDGRAALVLADESPARDEPSDTPPASDEPRRRRRA